MEKKKNKQTSNVSHKGKKYLTHDNGGRPFLVVINGKHVQIYKVPQEKLQEYGGAVWPNDYTELIQEYKNVKQVFIGKSSQSSKIETLGGEYGPKFDGNSVLIEIGNKRYCQIGESINEFSTKDIIKKYDSPVGRNDVPYPIAYGTEYIYFFVDDNKYIEKKVVSDKLSTSELWTKFTGECCPWKSELDPYKKIYQNEGNT